VTRPRRIVVNTAIYLHGTSGSARATASLVAALGDMPDAQVLEVAPERRGGRGSVVNAAHDAHWDLWRASRVRADVDLLVSPCNVGFRGPARKHLLVVYDVMVYDHPELFDRKFAAYFRLLVPRSIRSADRILTMSDHARERILRLAPGADVRTVNWPHAGGSVSRARWPDRPTVLMVGATEPVKNQVAGIEAVAALRRSSGADLALRLLGPVGRDEAAVRRALATVDPDGCWTSREVDVPDSVLDAAYTSSWLLLQPSLDEGFGLPLVEAARHGLPVVHSGRGAMPTVMPEVDARSIEPDALSVAMKPLLDQAHWSTLSAEAVIRSRDFDPDVFRAAIRNHVTDLLPVAA
jgi:glycosyltransferase involved in cell wall biosynthesis